MEEREQKISIFSNRIRKILEKTGEKLDEIQEIRMRAGKPLLAVYKNIEYAVNISGTFVKIPENGFIVTKEDIRETLDCASQYSLYAFEEEIRQGFLTAAGGHRIGIAGQAVINQGSIKNIYPVSALNIRFAHQIRGCADRIFPYLTDRNRDTVYHTLFISPPGCGKTTLLRDLTRQISDGTESFRGRNVSVADERSEIGASFQGVPQNDVGIRTDLLDGCPKAEGMMMLIRSMSPEVVVVDEIGGKKDLAAVRYAMNCGCKILAAVHGNSLEEVCRKPGFLELYSERLFERYVILSQKKGAGTLEKILDGKGNPILCG